MKRETIRPSSALSTEMMKKTRMRIWRRIVSVGK